MLQWCLQAALLRPQKKDQAGDDQHDNKGEGGQGEAQGGVSGVASENGGDGASGGSGGSMIDSIAASAKAREEKEREVGATKDAKAGGWLKSFGEGLPQSWAGILGGKGGSK